MFSKITQDIQNSPRLILIIDSLMNLDSINLSFERVKK